MVSFDRIAYYKNARIWLTVLWLTCASAFVVDHGTFLRVVVLVNALVWLIYSREVSRWIRQSRTTTDSVSDYVKPKDPDTP